MIAETELSGGVCAAPTNIAAPIPEPLSDTEIINSCGFFDPDWYIAANPDVAQSGIDPLGHYVTFGAAELRDPGPRFDARWYAAQHPGDPAATTAPLLHYVRKGGDPQSVVGPDPAAEPPAQPRFPGLEQHLWAEAAVVDSSGFFDPDWYIEANPDVAQSGIDPLGHYVTFGAAELRDPGPRFDALWYAWAHADDPQATRAPLTHYLSFGGAADADVGPRSRSAAVALNALCSVAGLDPEFLGLRADISRLRLPFEYGLPKGRAARAWKRLFASLEHPYARILFVPWLIRGGADLVAVYAARVAIERHGAELVLIVVTDSARTDALDWLPAEVHIRVLSNYGDDLTPEDRIHLVSWLIQALEPRSVLNVNSRACWEVIRDQGAALSTFCDLYATLFCRDYNGDGEAAGYADLYLRSTVEHLKAIYFDNAAFIRELADQFALPYRLFRRLRLIYQPAPWTGRNGFKIAASGATMSVLWAGRLSRQKNVELLISIARQVPEFQFEVYGSGEPEYEALALAASGDLGNLVCHGAYSSLNDLPTDQFGAFLYTTHWDGLPNVLLSAGAAGLPIVAPMIGGIGELIDHETGWPITDVDNPDAYVKALEYIRRDPAEAARRTTAMRSRIGSRHSWSEYLKAMSSEPSFLRG